jgi:DNA polymerase sigma
MKMELTEKQIERQDFIDNSIFELLQRLNPSKNELRWDIEIISKIREMIRLYFTKNLDDFSEQEYYPFLDE